MEFGDKMRTLRAQKKMTQAELAQRSGIPRGDISRIEKNRLMARAGEQKRIRKALGWTDEVDEALEQIGEVA